MCPNMTIFTNNYENFTNTALVYWAISFQNKRVIFFSLPFAGTTYLSWHQMPSIILILLFQYNLPLYHPPKIKQKFTSTYDFHFSIICRPLYSARNIILLTFLVVKIKFSFKLSLNITFTKYTSWLPQSRVLSHLCSYSSSLIILTYINLLCLCIDNGYSPYY